MNAVCPGFTDTPLLRKAAETIKSKTGRSEADALATLAGANPQGRLVTPQEVADTVLVAGVSRIGIDQWPGDRGRRRRGDGRMSDKRPFKDYQARHFLWEASDDGRVAILRLNRPERKNPLTFDSYAELRDLFRDLADASDVRAIVLTGAGGNFCFRRRCVRDHRAADQDGDAGAAGLHAMTGDLVKAMRKCPQLVIAAVDGMCAGAGAILAMASDLRLATPEAKTAFLFTRVGLSGADMGACGILPRIIGQGRAAELLLTGRAHDALRKATPGDSTTRCIPPPISRPRRSPSPARSPTARGSPMASPRPC